MRKAEFEVPSEVMAEFADEMVNRDLDNKVIGTNEDNEILCGSDLRKGRIQKRR
jgi:hypothetical protein